MCAIRLIPFDFVGCKSMLDKPWISGIKSKKQAIYQPVTSCTYWPVLGSYNNWNIIDITSKSTTFEAFDETHKVVLDRISENIASLVQSVMYGAINIDDTTKNGLYVIQFLSESYPFVGFDYYRCHFCTYVSLRQNLQYPFSAHVRHGIEFCIKNWTRWN